MICASQEDVQTAVFNAHEAFKAGVWSRAPALQRASVLSNLARDLEAHVPDLAKLETMQTGRAIREMNAQVCFHLMSLLCLHVTPFDQLGRLPEWLYVKAEPRVLSLRTECPTQRLLCRAPPNS